MKKSKLKKIVKKVHQEYLKETSNPNTLRHQRINDFCVADENLKKEITNLINDIIEHEIILRIYDNSISIIIEDVRLLKKSNLNQNSSNTANSYFELIMEKNKGFLLRSDNLESSYIYPELYDEFHDIIENKIIAKNNQDFNSIINSVIDKSGLRRDKNLTQLLDEE